jgi:hypothetical protein
MSKIAQKIKIKSFSNLFPVRYNSVRTKRRCKNLTSHFFLAFIIISRIARFLLFSLLSRFFQLQTIEWKYTNTPDEEVIKLGNVILLVDRVNDDWSKKMMKKKEVVGRKGATIIIIILKGSCKLPVPM